MRQIIYRELFFLWWRYTAWRIRRRGEPENLLVLTMISPQTIKETIRQIRAGEL